VRNVAQEALPFQKSTFNVTKAERFRKKLVLTSAMLNYATNGFTGSRPVGDWNAKLEVARIVGIAISALANQAKPP
jgi:hypothetical protein